MPKSPRWRQLIVVTVVVLGAASACSSTEDSPSRSAENGQEARGNDDPRPNIVFVLTDDLDATVMPYWDAMPKTRALIADNGLEFSNAFVTSPVCCPSRASIVSGRYPHNSGIFGGTPPDGGYQVFAENGVEEETAAVRLQEAGYQTAFMGKYLNGYERHSEAVPPGWDEWFGLSGSFLDGYGYKANHNGTTESFGSDEDDYQTDVLARQASSFLEGATGDDTPPFALFLWPSAPHSPIVPAERHRDNPFADAALPRRENFDEADVSDKPLWIREGTPPLGDDGIEMETELYRNGMGSLMAVDDMIDQVAQQLRNAGEFDNTVFVFTSDNGHNRGSHRLHHKTVPYEESLRVPLAVSGPGVRVGTEDRFVTNLDFAPTFLELAGAPIPSDVDGRSLVPLFGGPVDNWRVDFAVEFNGTYAANLNLNTLDDVERIVARSGKVPYSPTYRALRTQQYLYVEWYAGDEHEYELYDLAADPYQLENLLATPEGRTANQALTAELRARLKQLESCAGPSCRS